MVLRKLLAMYQMAIIKRPILSQAVQVGVLMGAGDVISQTIIEKVKLVNIDKIRSLKFATIGFCFVGPALRTWYGILNTYVGSKGKTVVIKKVLLDQLLFAPCLIFCLLIIVGLSHGKDWTVVKRELNEKYFDVLKANYCVWPWVQILNFSLVPLQYQVLVAQIFALLWNTYLAWKINRVEKKI